MKSLQLKLNPRPAKGFDEVREWMHSKVASQLYARQLSSFNANAQEALQLLFDQPVPPVLVKPTLPVPQVREPTSLSAEVNKRITLLKEASIQLAHGKLNYPIDTKDNDELGHLAKSIASMRDAIRTRMADLHTLNVICGVLGGTHDQRLALKTALRVMKEQINVEWGSVYLLNARNELEAQAYYPEREDVSLQAPRTFKIGEGVTGKTAESRQLIYIPDTSRDPMFHSHDSVRERRSILCVPMFDDRGIIGVMNFSGEVGKVHFEPADQEFALTIAQMTVVTTKNIQLEKEVQARGEAIQELLDNTGQGFFSFGEDYIVRAEYSKPCLTFFGKKLEKLDAVELLFAPGEVARDARRVLEVGFENEKHFEILQDLLPSEVTLRGRVISVDFRLIRSEQHFLKKYMVILTDITKEKEYAAHLVKERHNEMILKVALDREGFFQFLKEQERLYLSIYSLLAHPTAVIKRSLNELFRYYHTIKGGTASFGMLDVSETVHSIESVLDELRNGDRQLSNQYVLQLLDETQEVQQVFGQTLEELNNVIPKEERLQTERVYRIKDSRIVELKAEIRQALTAPNEQVERLIEGLRQQSVQRVLQSCAVMAENLAKQLNKPIQVVLQGEETRVSYERLDSFFGALIHLVRNCVDHGLEDTAQRQAAGKSEKGNLTLIVQEDPEALHITIADDGRGIDAKVIKTIALKNNVIDKNTASSMTEQELIELIFIPGFSTKDEVSSISGRGVGMDAVKATLDKLRGTIQIKTILNQGTSFHIVIPHQ
ncbi:ATP-binding protein [Deltaproteobacteria bacterium TL4]